jgi:hypothetical protein
MNKPTVREGFSWSTGGPTPIAPLAESGGCTVLRVGRSAQGERLAQIDLFVAAGQEGFYVRRNGSEVYLLDIPIGSLQPSSNMLHALPVAIGDPPPPHPPIGPGDVLAWVREVLLVAG